MKVAVVTDSTSDIPKEIAKKYDITIVPLNVHFDLDTYQDGVNITSEEFYKRLVSGKIFPTTSAPSSGIFLETYKKVFKNSDFEFCSDFLAPVFGPPFEILFSKLLTLLALRVARLRAVQWCPTTYIDIYGGDFTKFSKFPKTIYMVGHQSI